MLQKRYRSWRSNAVALIKIVAKIKRHRACVHIGNYYCSNSNERCASPLWRHIPLERPLRGNRTGCCGSVRHSAVILRDRSLGRSTFVSFLCLLSITNEVVVEYEKKNWQVHWRKWFQWRFCVTELEEPFAPLSRSWSWSWRWSREHVVEGDSASALFDILSWFIFRLFPGFIL